MTGPLCRACGRMTDASLCSSCAGDLARALRTVPELLDDLEVTLIRADRLGDAGRGGEQPVPFKDTVPAALWDLGNVLTTWTRDIARSRGLVVSAPARARRPARAIPPGARADEHGRPAMNTNPPDPAFESVRFSAEWLADHIGDIRALHGDEDAGQAHDEITDAIASTRRVIDRPATRVFVGACDECGADLFGVPDRDRASCRACGAVHEDMADRWEAALLKLRGYPATAATIAAMAGELYGVMIDRKLINQWHARGDIVPVPVDRHAADEGPRFRFGDVLDRAARSTPRGRRRAAVGGGFGG